MLSKEQIKQILVDQREAILNKEVGVERTILADIGKKIKLPHIIVISGLRRVGKSTLLRQIMQTYYGDKDFYYINFEDERLFNFNAKNFNLLYEALVELYGERKTFFIDEIQNVNNFENFVRRFYDIGFKFFVTGSNAKLLSREIGSRLTGRHVELVVNPFSFYEYLKFQNIQFEKQMLYKTEARAKLKNLFGKYLTNGGMPEFLKYKDPEILSRIYEDIVIKDIAVRYKIENLYEMRELYQYIITNFANKISFHSLKKIVGLGSITTVKKYVLFLAETFFISIVHKFDFSLKKQLVNVKKFYVADNGFIPRISTKVTRDKGWLLENYVLNVLKTSVVNIFYYSGQNECDFIVQKNKKITQTIQVTSELTDTNRQREINGLLEAMKCYELNRGLILTHDQEEDLTIGDYKVSVKPVWKWTLQAY
ncbi:archaeal ATPase [bacterium BMS3Abin15]|nr:archaeal ATPase [bacterium BMS3Abin15]